MRNLLNKFAELQKARAQAEDRQNPNWGTS